jgi:hypothetical protein
VPHPAHEAGRPTLSQSAGPTEPGRQPQWPPALQALKPAALALDLTSVADSDLACHWQEELMLVPLAPPSWSRLGPDLGSIRRWVRHSDRAALTLLADLGQCHSPWGQLTLADLDLPFTFTRYNQGAPDWEPRSSLGVCRSVGKYTAE